MMMGSRGGIRIFPFFLIYSLSVFVSFFQKDQDERPEGREPTALIISIVYVHFLPARIDIYVPKKGKAKRRQPGFTERRHFQAYFHNTTLPREGTFLFDFSTFSFSFIPNFHWRVTWVSVLINNLFLGRL